MKSTNYLRALIVLNALFLFSACDENKKSTTSKEIQTEETGNDIVNAEYKVGEGEKPNAYEFFKATDEFSTLAKAFDDAFKEKSVAASVGVFTILAPLNSAFESLPKDTLAEMFKPENKVRLAKILNNHVALENYPIKQLIEEAKAGRSLYMESGEYLPIEYKGEQVYIAGTKILKSVKIGNGWIHFIDTVLMLNPEYLKIPSAQKNEFL